MKIKNASKTLYIFSFRKFNGFFINRVSVADDFMNQYNLPVHCAVLRGFDRRRGHTSVEALFCQAPSRFAEKIDNFFFDQISIDKSFAAEKKNRIFLIFEPSGDEFQNGNKSKCNYFPFVIHFLLYHDNLKVKAYQYYDLVFSIELLPTHYN